MTREDREDTLRQQMRVLVARQNLAEALSNLAGEAALAGKAAKTKTGSPDLPAVYAASRAVERAEEALDTATYDLHTARGGDG